MTTNIKKPRTRGECKNVPRPCPFYSCEYHLAIVNVFTKGKVKWSRNPEEPWPEDQPSCVLDLVDGDAVLTLKDIGAFLQITRERVRQIEKEALEKLHEKLTADYKGVYR